MLRRTLLKWLGLAPAVAVIPPKPEIKKRDIDVLSVDGISERHRILDMTVGEFSDAKTVRMSPEELVYWDNYFKTKSIINKKMERPIDEEELKRQDEINNACKDWCHKCCESPYTKKEKEYDEKFKHRDKGIENES